MADGDLVANFMAITGADDGVAIQMLEAANFVLEDAVNLFFAADGHIGGGQGGGGGGSSGSGAGGGGGGHGGAAHGLDEDGVRAPLPSKVDRLYGDDDHRHSALDRARRLAEQQYLAQRGAQASTVDVFRDFRAETTAAQAAAAAGPGADAGASAQTQGLSNLFKLPADLVFAGNAEMAKQRAEEEGKWLLINIQSATEFASHRLNRDTWSHEALKEVLKGTFVFYQTQEASQEGRALIKAYHLDSQAASSGQPACPAILVVDPVTGAQLWCRLGFMDAEKLMEELVPFMDHGPMEPGAARIANANLKRKAAAPTAAAMTGGSGGGGGGSTASANRGAMTEDEELAIAIAMSMERGAGGGGAGGMEAEAGGSGGAAGGAMAIDDDLDEEAIWAQINAANAGARQEEEAAAAAAQSRVQGPEELAAEARARVPPEPADGDPEAVRVALRLPDGQRITRRFRRTEHVSVLYDFATAECGGKSVAISHATPGGAALSDRGQSLEAAGVAGAMLAVKLVE
ncbi:hypothetical protein HYH03_013515 [Edaphochlamys debaryana]|uniref:UBX domain-containing protein n=1 Tax=Edaphochlamys debaryana TaxID=47281 RepID=A0A835XQ03_9CHLO|nr:hypothetical protein HYH03_013515 [Edaphochlamys debaryana]|eukprot:KAG2487936.1 hypothetical protein HYH03_013515 [Edaphochlamys debaryana]